MRGVRSHQVAGKNAYRGSVGSQREAGWYADPVSPGQWRWWDGGSWTEYAVRADPKGEVLPPPSAASEGATPPGPASRPRPTSMGGPGGEKETATSPVLTSPGPTTTPATEATARTAQPPTSTAPGGSSTGPGTGVFARRWAALVGVVALLFIVLAIVLRGHSPALYWEGEPMSNASRVLAEAQTAMRATASADEGVVSPQSSCYFSLPNRSAHDVQPYVRCGPVFLPWSSAADAWLSYRLGASPTSSGVRLTVASSSSPPAATIALGKGEVLRRPGGGAPPPGDAALAPPAVPRQPPGWTAVLRSPPTGLQPAPVGDMVGDWGRSYRLVAFGETAWLSSGLDPAGLRAAVNPPGSAYAGGTSRDGRPQAKLLLPAKGQVLAIAELALSPGEAAAQVPALGGAGEPSSPDRPVLSVVAGGSTGGFDVPSGSGNAPANLTLAASVPTGSRPVLDIADKGLTQEVSLASGQVVTGPSVLSRLGTDEPLDVTGRLPGTQVHVSDASLVWFAGSDGGTVPPNPEQAYLQVLASASPLQSSFLPASDFTLELPAGQVVAAQELPDSDRAAILMGFLVPASFSSGTVVVSEGGRSLRVPVNFP